MADDKVGSAAASPANKKERSPSFPYIGLPKALERAGELYLHAKRHEARTADVAAAWGLAAKSSATLQTIGALIAFGLIEDQGSGDSRKFKISDLGFRALQDQRPGAKDAALQEAATRPKLIAEYAEIWKGGRPADGICISELHVERGFTEEGARSFLRVFDDTIGFAKTGVDDKKEDRSEPALAAKGPNAKVGDVVQWTSGGVDQFRNPATVVGVSEDRQWLWVAESQTGIPMNEVKVIAQGSDHTAGAAPPKPATHLASANPAAPALGEREEKFALQEGDVTIRFPENLSADSVEDLSAYIDVFLKKARRSATKN
ncbi:hypothetical protein [Methylocystis sp. Sn-Cys]|uniref:hypothetical protein n=1 Tax=Methylocystis sp. Sn-Cys TaxID=1701263 RepID=UPI00192260DB|nr:hypothetical protein [Methylocystis sp. Sn-Cys]MBL1256790.1 hypothetical protein [Methylocystis sp. Sn-Cys]